MITITKNSTASGVELIQAHPWSYANSSLHRRQFKRYMGYLSNFTRCSLNRAIIASLITLSPFCAFSGYAANSNLKASYYSEHSLRKEGTTKYSKNIMANGKLFDENALTCACRLYPLGTTLKITNLKNKKSVVVKVTDRIGKRFATSRIDLSKRAFSELADLKEGIVPITVEEI